MRSVKLFRRSPRWLGAVLATSLMLVIGACDDDPVVPEPDAAGDVGVGDDADARDADDDADFEGPSALLQVIHEAADPQLGAVDVWVDGERFVDDLAFRRATPYRFVAVGTGISLAIAPSDSTSADDAIAEFDALDLAEGDQVVALIHGVRDPQEVAGVGDGRDVSLGVRVLEDARTEAAGDRDEAVFFHSGPDVPAVDVVRDRDELFIDELGYAQFSEYVEFAAGVHTLDVVQSTSQRRLDSFQTPDFSDNRALVMVVSGFLEVEGTQRSELAVMAYRPDGMAIELDQAARLQVVHNSPDADVGPVDVYVDDERIAENLAFREATAFVSFVSETDLDVAIVPTGQATSAAVSTDTIQLGEGGSFIGVATGVTDPDAFESNPLGEDIGFELATAITRERAVAGDDVQLKAFHGVTDARAFDIVQINNGEQVLVNNLSYGEFSDLLSLDPQVLQMQVRLAGEATVLAELSLDLAEAAGEVRNLIASGFVDPDANPTEHLEDPDFAILSISQDGAVTVLKPAQ